LVHSNAQHQKIYVQASYDQVFFPFHNFTYHNNDFSYRVGGLVSLYISKHLAIASGINFESKKYSVNYPPRDSPNSILIEENFMFSYLSFPLIMEIDIINSRSHAIFIQSGLEIDRLLAYDYQKLYSDGTYHDPHEYSVNQNNFSIFVGPGYRYFFKNNLFLGFSTKFRYNLTNPGRTKGESTITSFILQFSSGYRF